MGLGFSEEGPSFQLTAEELADWVEHRGPESWWSVDGEQEFMESIAFPCASEIMARAIRKAGKDVVLFSVKNSADDPASDADKIIEGHSSYSEERGEWMLGLRWVGDRIGDNWMLLEDRETPRLVKRDLEEINAGGTAED